MISSEKLQVGRWLELTATNPSNSVKMTPHHHYQKCEARGYLLFSLQSKKEMTMSIFFKQVSHLREVINMLIRLP